MQDIYNTSEYYMSFRKVTSGQQDILQSAANEVEEQDLPF